MGGSEARWGLGGRECSEAGLGALDPAIQEAPGKSLKRKGSSQMFG